MVPVPLCHYPKTLQLHPVVKGSRTPHCFHPLLTLLTRDLLAGLFTSTRSHRGSESICPHIRPAPLHQAVLGLHFRRIRDSRPPLFGLHA